jgi:class 3 adenylate cyclase
MIARPGEAMKQPVQRRLAAILAANVAGFHSLIDADLGGTLRALKAIRRDLVDPTIEAHHGRLLRTSGDLLLVEFSNVVEALRCATDLHRTMAEHNRKLPAGKRIRKPGGSHVVFEHPAVGEAISVLAGRPIKPVYVRRFVAFIEAVRASNE